MADDATANSQSVDQEMIDPAPPGQKMADQERADQELADPDTLPTSTALSQPEDSIEIEADVKEEDDEGNVEDTTGGAPREGEKVEGKVTNPQYKALRAICDTLTNHKISRKGDE